MFHVYEIAEALLIPQTLHSHDYITCWSMFGHFPASLCLHRRIEQVWFHRVIWLPAERFDAPHVHLLMARPEKDVSKASLYSPFYCSIINNHSQVNWAVTDGILFDSCLPVACFSSFLALRCNCKQSNFLCGILLDNYFPGKSPEDALFCRQYV